MADEANGRTSRPGPTTVRQATMELFRFHGLTTWFGNPGSSELTLLQEFPADFRYFLGLQEMIPVGMADGSTRFVRSGVSTASWVAACDPRDDAIPASDW